MTNQHIKILLYLEVVNFQYLDGDYLCSVINGVYILIHVATVSSNVDDFNDRNTFLTKL